MKGGKKIGEVQTEFNDLFPYLKLEFYRNHQGKVFTDHNSPIAATVDIFALTKEYEKDYCIEFSEMTTVKELEKQIWKEMGVHARVFRKFGKAWLPVALTSDWTLKLQNEQGKALVNSPG
jgi:hypothetical protein